MVPPGSSEIGIFGLYFLTIGVVEELGKVQVMDGEGIVVEGRKEAVGSLRVNSGLHNFGLQSFQIFIMFESIGNTNLAAKR